MQNKDKERVRSSYHTSTRDKSRRQRAICKIVWVFWVGWSGISVLLWWWWWLGFCGCPLLMVVGGSWLLTKVIIARFWCYCGGGGGDGWVSVFGLSFGSCWWWWMIGCHVGLLDLYGTLFVKIEFHSDILMEKAMSASPLW